MTKTLFLLLLLPFLGFAQIKEGSYSIKSTNSAPYNSLANIIAQINLKGIEGAVTLLLEEDQIITSQIVINKFDGSSTQNTLTIKPNVGKKIKIRGQNLNGYTSVPAIFVFNGTSNIIIDGSNSDTNTNDLTIINEDQLTYANRTIIFVASDSKTNTPSTNIIVRNSTLQFTGTNGAENLLVGVYSGNYQIGSNNTLSIAASKASNSGITIKNNIVVDAREGVNINGDSDSSKTPFDWKIQNNIIGSTIDSNKPEVGIIISNAKNYEISNNTISGILKSTSTTKKAAAGITILGQCTGNIYNNTITDVNNTNYNNGSNTAGIFINTSSTSITTIYNNIISNIYTPANDNSNDNLNYKGHGIYLKTGGTTKLYYNTIVMNSTKVGSQYGKASCLYIEDASSVDLKNNILYNNLQSGTQYTLLSFIALSKLTSNYNSFYVTNSNLNNVIRSDSNLYTFDNWKKNVTKDAQSVNSAPVFMNVQSDLHLHPTNPANDVLLGQPISTITTTDIDGETRVKPYMGADEIAVCIPPTITKQLTAAQTQCLNIPFSSISVTATGTIASGKTTLSYQWYSNITNTTTGGISLESDNGAKTNSYTPQSTVAGNLFYYCVVTGACGQVTSEISGAFKTNPNNTITLSSGPETDSQTQCINTAITPITYNTIGATGATVTGLPDGVTGSWALDVVTISGKPTISKATPFNYTITLIGGCGTISATGTITVKSLLVAPTIGLITPPTCNTPTGSVVLSGLPSTGTLIQSDGTTISRIEIPNPPTISGLAPGTYKFAVDDCTPVYSKEVIIKAKTKTWNGEKWSNDHKTPTIDDIVDFQSDFEMNSDMNFCSVTVSKGVKVTVKDGITMNVLNGLHVDLDPTTSLTFENNASLMQTNATSDINTGIIEYKRTAGKILRGDYVYWSTPVSPQTLFNLSPLTSGDKYMWYNGDNANWVIAKGSDPMMPGKGYIVRGPQNYSNNEGERKDYPASFKGTPNNGDILGETIKADKYYLIGNPYPSALRAKEFLNNNQFILGTLYFWTHNTRVSLQGAYEYASDDYATYNLTGSTTAAPSGSITGNNNERPSGYIAAGQSFFARMKPTTDPIFDDTTPKVIAFNNKMRIGGDNNNLFFKPGKTSKETDIDRSRIWLNLTNTKGAFKQALVGYVDGATNDFDDRYDGISFDGNDFIDFYSVNNQRKFTIQGRALPFENTDLVPMGYRTTIAGDFTISIDEGDGVFTEQAIYLEDKKTGTVNDLRAANYTFTTTAGTFNDRFVLRYTNKTLGTDDFENLENTILVSTKNKVIQTTSNKEAIKEVTVFDISGKLLYNKNKVNATELQISNLYSSNQVLLVKVTLENGYATTKKIIFQ